MPHKCTSAQPHKTQRQIRGNQNGPFLYFYCPVRPLVNALHFWASVLLVPSPICLLEIPTSLLSCLVPSLSFALCVCRSHLVQPTAPGWLPSFLSGSRMWEVVSVSIQGHQCRLNALQRHQVPSAGKSCPLPPPPAVAGLASGAHIVWSPLAGAAEPPARWTARPSTPPSSLKQAQHRPCPVGLCPSATRCTFLVWTPQKSPIFSVKCPRRAASGQVLCQVESFQEDSVPTKADDLISAKSMKCNLQAELRRPQVYGHV